MNDFDIVDNQKLMMDLSWLGLIIPVAYILISLFFLCFPSILHKKARYQYEMFNDLLDSDRLLCIGHRGGSFEGPENTIQVFKRNSSRSHMFQLDVCFTKDKQLVVHHDLNLKRTCGVDRQIAELNYSELPHFMDQYESFGGGPIKTSKNKITLLDELFTQFPDMPMNIELKTPSEQSIQEFNRLVQKHHRQSFTVWGAMKDGMNDRLREVNPQVVNFYSIYEVFKIFLLCISGLLPFVCIRQGVLDIPLAGQGFNKVFWKFFDTGCKKFLGCIIICILKFFTFIHRLFVPHLRKRGILTFHWILNDEEDFEHAIDIGAKGIMTDRTQQLSRYLKCRNLYYQKVSDSF